MPRKSTSVFIGLTLFSISAIAVAQSVDQKPVTADKQMSSKPLITEQQSSVIRTEVGKAKIKAVGDDSLSIQIDTKIPGNVVLYELPPEAVKAVPEYLGHKYIIVKNDIAIVDPISRKVIAVVN